MKEFKVTVTVRAADIIEAELLKDGLQNTLNELGNNQDLLLRLADPHVARSYAAKVKQLITSPLMQKIAKSFE